MTDAYYVIFVIFVAYISCVAGADSGIRGLPPAKLPLYDSSKNFQCLDGSLSIPFTHINDDYCDCQDGSDEPGTSACSNGSFYCQNPGYKPVVIPSSRISDGICDCCDGEDEYNSNVQCTNLCIELGKQLKEDQEKMHKLKLEGYDIYQQYVNQGMETRANKKARLEELQVEKDSVDMERATLEKRKNELEQPEKEAKELHEKWWEEEKAKRKEERKLLSAKAAFEVLDTNHDERVSIEELASHLEFDIDSNGEVSVEEAKEYLEENNEVAFDVFSEKIWDNIREIYRQPGDVPSPSTEEPAAEDNLKASDDAQDNEESDYDREDNYGDADDDNDEEGDERGNADDPKESDTENKEEVEEQMPDYDEATKYLIDAADQARREYNAIDSRFRDIDNEIKDIKKVLDQDLGVNGEYYPLMGQCFDFTDREYVYSLCPFDRASQRGKNGGVETNLGRWGSWAGSSVMKYEHGQNCWNGPDRSATIHIECGLSNELLSVAEPNRCEYRFTFSTPAACNQPPEPIDSVKPHTEL